MTERSIERILQAFADFRVEMGERLTRVEMGLNQLTALQLHHDELEKRVDELRVEMDHRIEALEGRGRFTLRDMAHAVAAGIATLSVCVGLFFSIWRFV